MKIEQSTEFLNQQILELREQRAALEKRVLEECRLNAMGAEREARLQARVAELEQERDKLVRAVSEHMAARVERQEELAASEAQRERLIEAVRKLRDALWKCIEPRCHVNECEMEDCPDTDFWQGVAIERMNYAQQALAETADALRGVL